MVKKLTVLISSFFLLLTIASPVSAKRLLPHARKSSSTSSRAVRSTRGVTAGVRFRGDRRGIVVTFSNLSIAKAINYQLSYSVRGTTQGAGGALSPGSPDPSTRELIFGTCSHGVCRYDSGITNARFTVTTTLKNGLKIVKRFRLKV